MVSEAADRTRALFARELGLDLTPREVHYRDQAAGVFEGEWLGAFAQPSIVLNKVTPVSLRLDATTGNSVDEYGKAQLGIRRDGDFVQLVKSYEGRDQTGRFVYIGRFEAGALAGYWYSPLRPQFCGVFWFSRVDQLADATAEKLRSRVRSTSPKRTIVKAGVFAVVTGSIVLAGPAPAIALGLAGVGVLATITLNTRARALRREVIAWQRALGAART